MKQSEYLKVLKLAKRTLQEYKNWGEEEVSKDAIPEKPSANLSKEQPCAQSAQKSSSKDSQSPAQRLEALKKKLDSCKKCALGHGRLNCVFGEGSAEADLMFVGEGPGFDEDHKGLPFIGRAGQLLTKIIEAMGKTRESVYIANIVKCHPMQDPSDPEKRGNDRPPTPEEMESCKPFLDMQIEIIKPKIIVTLGASSTKGLLKNEESISAIRGNFKEYNGIKLMPTYHPAALLRNPSLKKAVWEDMKQVMKHL